MLTGIAVVVIRIKYGSKENPAGALGWPTYLELSTSDSHISLHFIKCIDPFHRIIETTQYMMSWHPKYFRKHVISLKGSAETWNS